jgi:hypothetical protein
LVLRPFGFECSPATLIAAGRITVLHPSALATLSSLFAQDPAPCNVAGF